MRSRCAFTLPELLVVVGIVGLLISILLPALAAARRASQRVNCLSNLRGMQVAHWMYVTDNKGYLIQAGLSHGGHSPNEEVAWINTLSRYYGKPLLHRCPSDNSPHWPGGVPVPPSTDRYRRTSYGINNFLDVDMVPWGGPYLKIHQVRRPAATIQFIEMTETGEFAGADHPHIDNWTSNIPFQASRMLATSMHGGRPRSWESACNYGFLDGHAETLRLSEVFTDFTKNKFDPAVAY